jgi:PAS domain S-box-containing protein
MSLSLREKVGLTLAGLLLLAAGPAVLAYRSSNQFLAATDSFLLAQSGLSDLRSAFSLVQDMETSQRGYTLTGDTVFLGPYWAARTKITARLAAIRPMLAETPGGPQLLDSLSALIAQKQSELDRVIELRRDRGFEAAKGEVAAGGGRRTMDQIRARVTGIEAMAQVRLRAARDRAAAERDGAVIGLAIAGLAALALALAAGTLISRDLAADRLAKDQLASTGERLSAEVAGMSATLAARAEELGAIVAAVPVALVTIDHAGLVAFWSPAAERMFGWQATEVVGKPLPIIPPGREEEYRRFRESVLGGKAFSGRETRRLRRDGTELDVAVSTAPLRDAAGNIHALVASYVDMSGQRRLEEELRQSQKLEAIGRLAGGVAHDFNNLLTAVLGFADRVSRALPADHPQRRDVDEITVAAERAAGLTRQLLTFSRPQPVAPRVLDLGGVVRAMEPMLRQLLGETIDLSCSIARDSGRILADAHHLEQVLLNLSINARDAMPRGGRLLIETAAVELASPYLDEHPEIEPGAYSMLAVSDTGTGMDQATRDRIFEPFFTTKGGMGSGLGLATVYGIVKQTGGGILVYSEPGHGTTFKIYFPRTDMAMAPEKEPAHAPAISADGVSILLVEDNPSVRNLAVAMLQDEGFRVLAHASAEEALEAAAGQEHFELLITDIVLGGMDGAELAARLRQSRPGLPVIYMSGYTEDTELVRTLAHQEGARFLEKPFRHSVLLRRVSEALGGHARAPAPGDRASTGDPATRP